MFSLSKSSVSTLSYAPTPARRLFRSNNPSWRSIQDKRQIASNSRRTPSQLMKVLAERKKHENLRSQAYSWCVEEAKKRGTNKKKESIKSICARGSVNFNLYIPPSSIYTMLREDRSKILKSGPKTKFPRSAYRTLGYCINKATSKRQQSDIRATSTRH